MSRSTRLAESIICPNRGRDAWSAAPIVRSLAAVFLASVVTLCSPAAASALEKGVVPDLTWDIPKADFAPTQSAITDVGAEWVRLQFRWYEAETRKGAYSKRTLAKWDRAVEVSEAAGARIIAIVHRSPQWASGAADTYSPPQNVADYANFMRFLAERYRGRVAAWEIWNEQNSARFWPTGPDATEYVQLLRAAYPAVKQGDPSALVAFGGLAYSDYVYVSQAYEAGAKGWFDVMTTHPYSDQYAPDHAWYAEPGLPAVKSFTAYREVRRRMLAYGDDKPIWFTEFGWSTTTTSTKGVTQAQQASYLTRALCIMEQDPYVGVAVWYNLRNNHWNDDSDSWETQLGLMKTTFERKPSYDAFKNYSAASCSPAPEPAAAATPVERDPTEAGATTEPSPPAAQRSEPAAALEPGAPRDVAGVFAGGTSIPASSKGVFSIFSRVARAVVPTHLSNLGAGPVRGADRDSGAPGAPGAGLHETGTRHRRATAEHLDNPASTAGVRASDGGSSILLGVTLALFFAVAFGCYAWVSRRGGGRMPARRRSGVRPVTRTAKAS